MHGSGFWRVPKPQPQCKSPLALVLIQSNARPEYSTPHACRTGYQTGINWSERGNLSLEPGSTDVLEPGMTFHMPIILFQEGEYGLGCSENVVVTERGAEILSSTPHSLYRA